MTERDGRAARAACGSHRACRSGGRSSIGEPGGIGSRRRMPAVCAPSDLDAHRDHRRLHLLDDVGKADRRRAACCACSVRFCASARRDSATGDRARTNSAPAPRPAMVVASKRDAAQRQMRGVWKRVVRHSSESSASPSRIRAGALQRAVSNRRWGCAPYSALAAGLNFGKVARMSMSCEMQC